MKLCTLIFELHLPQNFCHRHVGKHFLKIVKSCSEYWKTCKSTKNRKSKKFKGAILTSIYAEESNKVQSRV